MGAEAGSRTAGTALGEKAVSQPVASSLRDLRLNEKQTARESEVSLPRAGPTPGPRVWRLLSAGAKVPGRVGALPWPDCRRPALERARRKARPMEDQSDAIALFQG